MPDFSTLVGSGVTGHVNFIDNFTVVKDTVFHIDETRQRDIDIEKRVYRRLGSHPRICKFLGSTEHTITLKRYVECVRKRLQSLRALGGRPTDELALKWSAQAAEGMAYLHSKCVLQCDINCANFLLDEDNKLVICDFAGSSVDGEEALACSGTRYKRPYKGEITSSLEDDIFAFGSAVYEISTTAQPYQDEESGQVAEKFGNRQFPDVGHLKSGKIIMKCWNGRYKAMDEVYKHLQQILENLDHSQPSPLRRTTIFESPIFSYCCYSATSLRLIMAYFANRRLSK